MSLTILGWVCFFVSLRLAACSDCAPGSFSVGALAAQCSQCPAGSFSAALKSSGMCIRTQADITDAELHSWCEKHHTAKHEVGCLWVDFGLSELTLALSEPKYGTADKSVYMRLPVLVCACSAAKQTGTDSESLSLACGTTSVHFLYCWHVRGTTPRTSATVLPRTSAFVLARISTRCLVLSSEMCSSTHSL